MYNALSFLGNINFGSPQDFCINNAVYEDIYQPPVTSEFIHKVTTE